MGADFDAYQVICLISDTSGFICVPLYVLL